MLCLWYKKTFDATEPKLKWLGNDPIDVVLLEDGLEAIEDLPANKPFKFYALTDNGVLQSANAEIECIDYEKLVALTLASPNFLSCRS